MIIIVIFVVHQPPQMMHQRGNQKHFPTKKDQMG